jgi:hypothetical protein
MIKWRLMQAALCRVNLGERLGGESSFEFFDSARSANTVKMETLLGFRLEQLQQGLALGFFTEPQQKMARQRVQGMLAGMLSEEGLQSPQKASYLFATPQPAAVPAASLDGNDLRAKVVPTVSKLTSPLRKGKPGRKSQKRKESADP